jgi:chorismate mutase
VTAVRAVRGAIQIDRDDPAVIRAETGALLTEVMRRNALAAEDIISVVFTVTPDLSSGFPAAAARGLGLTEVPLLCATEIDVPDALPRVIRLLAHIQTDLPQSAVEHVYLRGAVRLRPDLQSRRGASARPATDVRANEGDQRWSS